MVVKHNHKDDRLQSSMSGVVSYLRPITTSQPCTYSLSQVGWTVGVLTVISVLSPADGRDVPREWRRGVVNIVDQWPGVNLRGPNDEQFVQYPDDGVLDRLLVTRVSRRLMKTACKTTVFTVAWNNSLLLLRPFAILITFAANHSVISSLLTVFWLQCLQFHCE